MIFKVYSSLNEHTHNWDHLLPEKHALRSANLLLLENSCLQDIQFMYLFFYNQEETDPVAIAYFQYVHFTTRHYQFPLIRNVIIQPFEKLVMRGGFKILICGNLFRVDFPGLFMQNGKPVSTDILTSLEQFFNSIRPSPHAILLKDWQANGEGKWLKDHRYHIWPDDLTMKLDLSSEWTTFPDYISAQKHKYAQRVRKVQTRCAAVIRKELQLDEIISYSHELEELYKQVVKKQAIRLVIANRNYFIEMKKAYGNSFRIIGYFEKNQLIAFSSHLIYPDSWELHYVGMDYIKNEFYWLYFNMMYDGIALAIEGGKKTVELGRTARQAKAMLGGKPIYFTSYFRLRGWVVNQLVTRLAGNFNEKAGESWQLRNPFKK
ncbi:MAG: hypothetical protein ABIO46_09875 [Chitinophagales bacterium]